MLYLDIAIRVHLGGGNLWKVLKSPATLLRQQPKNKPLTLSCWMSVKYALSLIILSFAAVKVRVNWPLFAKKSNTT